MLRAIVDFEHCVKNQESGWMTESGYAITQVSMPSAKGLVVDSYGGLSSPLSAARPDPAQWVLDLSAFIPETMESMTLCMTARHRRGGSTGVLYSIAGDVSQSDKVDLLTFEELPSTNENRSTFVQMDFSLMTGAVKIYLDGVMAKYLVLPSALYTRLRRKVVLIGTTAPGGSLGVCSTGDIYLVDNLGADGFDLSKGKCWVGHLTISGAVAEGWVVPENKTALQVLQTPLGPTTVDVVTSPIGESVAPLTVALSSSQIPSDSSIVAVSIQYSGKVSNEVAKATSRLQQRGILSPLKPHLLPTTLKYGLQGGIFIDSMDGGMWTTAKVDDSFVIISTA